MPSLNRQPAKICGQPDKLDFTVPDSVWRAVVPTHFQRTVVTSRLTAVVRLPLRLALVPYAAVSITEWMNGLELVVR
jgi:hypothetical protein